MARLAKLAAALMLLAALYWHCDSQRVMAALAGLDVTFVLLAFLLFLPQTAVSAWRWQRLAGSICPISFPEAVRQTLAASAWNLAAPSKLGELSKAAMLPLASTDRRRALALVIIEKIADVAALALLWLLAATWLSLGSAAVMTIMLLATIGWQLSNRLPNYSAIRIPQPAFPLSLLLWFLHLAQIHLMVLAADVPVDFVTSFARLPAAIFAGLVPLSLCGIGPRDGALIWLFSDVAPASAMAAVGLLTATRYLVPGAAGIPFIWKRGQADRIWPAHRLRLRAVRTLTNAAAKRVEA